MWTSQQVLDLAPDASAAKAARSCTAAAKWVTLGKSETALWGEFQGSGAKPYQTQVDLREPAFKCSCPSRKFPCKHGLGIMLLLAERSESIAAGEPPAWVAEWLTDRERRSDKRQERAAAKAEAPADPEAQRKRAAAREQRILAGLEELAAFLQDLVRNGLAAVQAKPAAYFDTPAARLVDAQAPGLARMVQRLGELAASGEGWQQRLLSEIGRIHLITEAYRRIEQLPPASQAEVRSLVGWTTSQDELLQAAGLRGQWIVAAQQVEQDQRIITQRTWLIERERAQPAMVLQFAAGGAPLDWSLVVGTQIDAELVYFPAATPLRALVKHREGSVAGATTPAGMSITAALDVYAAALAASPWLGGWPMMLAEVVPVREDGRWFLRDADGSQLPVPRRFERGWELLAVSGGHPVGVFGEWNGEALAPLAVFAADQLIPLTGGGAGMRAA